MVYQKMNSINISIINTSTNSSKQCIFFWLIFQKDVPNSNLILTSFEPKSPDNKLALPKIQTDPRPLTIWCLQFTSTLEYILIQSIAPIGKAVMVDTLNLHHELALTYPFLTTLFEKFSELTAGNRCLYGSPFHGRRPHFNPNHNINYEPIEINIEAAINKEKIHLKNKKSRYSILEETNDRSKTTQIFFDDIHAHNLICISKTLNEFVLACAKIRIYLIWFHCYNFSFTNPKLILIHLIINYNNN